MGPDEWITQINRVSEVMTGFIFRADREIFNCTIIKMKNADIVDT